MNTGIEFENEKVSESFSTQLVNDTQQSMTEDINVKLTIPCTGQVGSEGGVGLWQFVMQTADRYS